MSRGPWVASAVFEIQNWLSSFENRELIMASEPPHPCSGQAPQPQGGRQLSWLFTWLTQPAVSGFKKPVSSRAHHIRRGLQARILQQSFEAAVRRMSSSGCSSTQHGCMVKGSESCRHLSRVMTSSLLSHDVTSPVHWFLNLLGP